MCVFVEKRVGEIRVSRWNPIVFVVYASLAHFEGFIVDASNIYRDAQREA